MSRGFVVADGVRLYFEDRGEGRPVMLLHGFAGSTETMADVASALSRRHRVVSLDLIGHGRSDSPQVEEQCTMAAVVGQVRDAVETLGLVPVDLVGYSMGGRVALSIAVSHPGLLASVAVVGASAGIEDAVERVARARCDARLADRIESNGIAWFADYWASLDLLRPASPRGERLASRVRGRLLQNDPAALGMLLKGLGTGAMPYIGGRLASLHLPVLFAAGSEDERYIRAAETLARLVSDARTVVVSTAGHRVPIDNPDGLAAAILSFLADVETGAWA